MRVLCLFTILLSFCEHECAILVGGLFNETENGIVNIDELVFKHAIHKANENLQGNGIAFEHDIRFYRPQRSSFVVEKHVCELLSRGIAGIFGPQYGDSAAIVQSVCDAKEIPHIETRWDPKQKVGSCSVNLHPHPDVVCEAFVAVVEAYGWDKYTILYESAESLLRVAYLLNPKLKTNTTVTVKLRQIEPDSPGSTSYRRLLRAIRESDEHNIVLQCSTELLPEVLRQAQQVSLMGADHSYLITNLDFFTLPLEQYQFGGTNITGFRLFTSDDIAEFVEELRGVYSQELENSGLTSQTFSMQAALIHDAVQLYARATESVLDDEFKRSINAAPCNTEDTWQHGYSIINYMKLLTMKGLTGDIKFDEVGFRTNFNLHIFELTETGIENVGKWNKFGGAYFFRQPEPNEKDEEFSLRNKTLKVVIALTKPYAMRVTSRDTLSGNDQYEGFCVDLIQELSNMNDKFDFTFIVEKEGKSGSPIPNTNPEQWDGMIGYILRGEADLACVDLTISRDREEVVDLTSPFMDLGVAILYKKPKTEPPGFFSFLSPFDESVWISVITAYVSMSLLFFLMGRISPYEWRNPFPCIDDPDELENQFTLSNSFWFTIGALMQQGSEIAPVAVSTRMAAGLWWFFTLIMVACYTANLAAFLTAKNPQQDFSEMEDLAANAEKLGIKYGAKANGTTLKFFNDTDNLIYKGMFKVMMDNPEVLTKNSEEGVRRVKSDTEKYAFFMESSQIDYTVERECELTQVGKPRGTKGYAVAMKKGSWYLSRFSQSILKMQETGKLTELKTTWWKEKYAVTCAKDEQEVAEQLGLANLGGVFLVLASGVLVGLTVAICEQFCYSWNVSKEEEISLKHQLRQEFKFFLRCRGTTKTVNTKQAESEPTSENSGVLLPS